MKKFFAILLLLPSFAFGDAADNYILERGQFANAARRSVESAPRIEPVSGLFSQWQIVAKVYTTNTVTDKGGLRCSSVNFSKSGIIHLYFAGYSNAISPGTLSAGRVHLATGLTWTELTTHGVVIDLGTNGTWDSGNIGSARIYSFDDSGTNYLYYFASTNTTFETGWQACGVAYTTDGTNFTKYSGNPIVNAGADGDWDEAGIQGAQCVIKHDGRYYMFFSGKNDGGSEKCGLAFADNPLGPWKKYQFNPVVDAGSQLCVEPNVMRYGSGWVMFFGDGGYARSAFSTDLTNWTVSADSIYFDDPGYGAGDGLGVPGSSLSPYYFDDSGPAFLLDDTRAIFIARPQQSPKQGRVSGWFQASTLYATNLIGLRTNYVSANFEPESGIVKFVGSNNAVFAVSRTKTNLISAP